MRCEKKYEQAKGYEWKEEKGEAAVPVIPEYDQFINNAFVKSIADKEKWTISTSKKMPVDMFQLLYRNRIAGAVTRDSTTLTTLSTIHKHLPNAANFAYYLDARVDGFVVLDIEPSCPEDIRNQLVSMNWVYAETSMSGKGIHLVFPLPESFYDYPEAIKKTAFIHKDRIYEILLVHFVTFTAAPISEALAALRGTGQDFTGFFNTMVSQQREIKKADLVVQIPEDIDEDPLIQAYIGILTHDVFGKEDGSEIAAGHKSHNTIRSDSFFPYKKRLSDFRNEKTGSFDHSRFECSMMGYCSHTITRLRSSACLMWEYIKISDDPFEIEAVHRRLTDSEKAWIMYKTAEHFLIPREKHKETRSGLPWLMYIAQYILAAELAKKEESKL